MLPWDQSEVVDAILSKAGQSSIDRHTQEELSEIRAFCSSVNDALDVYGVKGVDVNLVIEDGVPEDIAAFKQKCRAILDQLKATSSPDAAVREARISLQRVTSEVWEEIASRFTFCSPVGVGSHIGGHAIDIDFLADGFIVRNANEEDGATALVTELDGHPAMLNWSALARSERNETDLPKFRKLEPLREYNVVQNRSLLEEIKQGILPKECRKRVGGGKPIPTIFRVHDYRPRLHAELNKAVDNLKQMHEQQKRERIEAEQEAERKRQEAEQEAQRKRHEAEQEAERKKRQDRLLSLEEASRVRLKEMEETEVAAHSEEEAKQSEEKGSNAVVSALVALRNKYKESDLAGLVTCLTTLQTYIKNLSSNPEEPKFRHINMENGGFKKRVAAFEGAIAVLLACGFHQETSTLVYVDVARSSEPALSDVLRKIDILVDQLKR